MKRRLITLADVLIAIATAAICAAVMLAIAPKGQGKNAVIYYKGDYYTSLPLSEDADVTVKGVTLSVRSGKAYVTDSTCPDKVCMQSKLHKSGDITVCMPNAVTVIIDGESDRDGITY